MSGRFAVLHQAMQILGARSVTVFAVSTGSEVWSKTGTSATSDAGLAAVMADMVAAAGRLATVADPDGPLDEVLALDELWFHVLYPIDSLETGPQVGYLLLERNVANLAAARREFRTLVQAVPASPPGPTSPSEETTTPGTTPHGAGRPAFPRRIAAIPTEPGALPEDRTFGEHTRWLNQAAGPFVSDERTLRRLLEALRQL